MGRGWAASHQAPSCANKRSSGHSCWWHNTLCILNTATLVSSPHQYQCVGGPRPTAGESIIQHCKSILLSITVSPMNKLSAVVPNFPASRVFCIVRASHSAARNAMQYLIFNFNPSHCTDSKNQQPYNKAPDYLQNVWDIIWLVVRFGLWQITQLKNLYPYGSQHIIKRIPRPNFRFGFILS